MLDNKKFLKPMSICHASPNPQTIEKERIMKLSKFYLVACVVILLAGLIVGRAALVEALRRHPLARALRVDKSTLAALQATLLHYVRGEAERAVPVWRMIAAPLDELAARAEVLAARLRGAVEGRFFVILAADRLRRLVDGLRYFLDVERDLSSVALDDFGKHCFTPECSQVVCFCGLIYVICGLAAVLITLYMVIGFL